MSRNTYDAARIRYEEHSPPAPIEAGPPSPPVHPKLLEMRRALNTMRFPLDMEREVRSLRRFILQLAEQVYSNNNNQETK